MLEPLSIFTTSVQAVFQLMIISRVTYNSLLFQNFYGTMASNKNPLSFLYEVSQLGQATLP